MPVERFAVKLSPPLDVAASLEPFRRVDDGIDRWDGRVASRTVPVGERAVPYAFEIGGDISSPQVQVTVESRGDTDVVGAAVRNTFMPLTSRASETLRRDPVLRVLDDRHPGLRPVRQFDLMSAIVRCISAQQVNVAWAATTRRRLAEAFGTRHELEGRCVFSLEAVALASLEPSQLRALQFTGRKAEYIVEAAQAIVDGRLDARQLQSMSNEEVVSRLVSIRGLGRWSAEWLLLRFFGRPTVVAGDLAVRKAVGKAYEGDGPVAEAEVRDRAVGWGDAAAVAQALLLHDLGQQ